MNSPGDKDPESRIRCISLAENVVRHPERYWGMRAPDCDVVIEAIVDQIKTTTQGEIRVFKERDGWCYVGSDKDWIAAGLLKAGSIENLFKKAMGLSEVGQNSLRIEFFLSTFAETIVLWRGHEIFAIQGSVLEGQKIFFEERYTHCVAVGFHGNVYSS